MIRRPRSRPRRPRDVPATGGSQAPLPSLSTSGFCKTRGTDSGRNGSGLQRGFSLDDDARRSVASCMRRSAILASSPRGPPEPKHPAVGDPLGRTDRDPFGRSVHPRQHRSVQTPEAIGRLAGSRPSPYSGVPSGLHETLSPIEAKGAELATTPQMRRRTGVTRSRQRASGIPRSSTASFGEYLDLRKPRPLRSLWNNPFQAIGVITAIAGIGLAGLGSGTPASAGDPAPASPHRHLTTRTGKLPGSIPGFVSDGLV
jgi:hypothetical protein